MKVVICGPGHSGKSCLREGLKQAIRRQPNAPYPYFITACPDGEGAWYSATAQADPALAREAKAAYKAKFTPEFASVRAAWVRDASEPLTLIDVGGRLSCENWQIMQHATHAVILSGRPRRTRRWRSFCEGLGLQIVAVLHSDYHATSDRIETTIPVLTGTVHYLERGVDVSQRPMVQALAQLLVRLAGESL